MDNLLDTRPLVGDITQLGEDMLAKIKMRHIEAGQRVTGRTSDTLRIVPTATGFQLQGWKYAGSYEEGRAPGTMPPPQAILEWARAKGIMEFKSESQAKSWAFAVALRIKRLGTKRYQQATAGNKTDIFDTPIQEMTQDLQGLISRYHTQAIRRELLRTDLNTK